jgi:acyl-coenzyme A thioesterase PaaI-like protein
MDEEQAGKSLQERYAPNGICFGCGPANPKGLRIRSFETEEGSGVLVATFVAEPHHQAFPGVLNGGICGALLDCHANWTAAIALMRGRGDERPPCTVTADFAVRLRRPTPIDGPISLQAEPAGIEGDKAKVEATLEAGGKICATCSGTFVAVQPGHPAYHRW